jgi:hypothetical protein
MCGLQFDVKAPCCGISISGAVCCVCSGLRVALPFAYYVISDANIQHFRGACA